MTHHATAFLLVALLSLTASAQNKCDAQAEAEQSRIIRELSSQPPSKHDQEAQLAWSKKMNAALAAAAQRHEDCRRSSRSAISSATVAKEKECIAESNRRAEDLQKRYRGRNPTAQEQATRRAEEQRLIDDRMSCTNNANR